MKVFCNGLNLFGQLPINDILINSFASYIVEELHNIEVSYTFVASIIAGKLQVRGKFPHTLDYNSSQLACNDSKILIMKDNSELLQLSHNPPTIVNTFGEKFARISCGAKLTVALTATGSLYNMPNKLDFQGAHLVDVKTGREHCLLLDNQGQVFSFGRGSRGQLGHSTLDDELEPKLVDALAGIKIKLISAGGWHSCAVSTDGDLYCWGWNGSGQLGLGSDGAGVMACPQPVDFNGNIQKVACGNKHTLILLDDGKLYGCGWNKYKQLKDCSEEFCRDMTYLWDFAKERVVDIKCGPWNSVVVCA